MVEVHAAAAHDALDRLGEELQQLVDHRLVLHALAVLPAHLRVLLVGVEGRERVVVDERDEEAEGGEGQLAVLPDQPHHRCDRLLVGHRLDHLLPVLDQVVLVHRLDQHRAQVLHHCRAAGRARAVLSFDALDDGPHEFELEGELVGVGCGALVDVEVEEELDGVGDGHVFGVAEEVVEDAGLGVDAVDGLLVAVVEQAEVGPEEVAGQQRQQLGLVEQREEQVEVEQLLGLALLEEAVEDAGGLGLDHLDHLQGQLVLALVGVLRLRRDGQVADCLRDQPGVVGEVVEQLGVVGLELLRELGHCQQLVQLGLALQQRLDLLRSRFTVPGRHLINRKQFKHPQPPDHIITSYTSLPAFWQVFWPLPTQQSLAIFPHPAYSSRARAIIIISMNMWEKVRKLKSNQPKQTNTLGTLKLP